jgi:hypothetical protein
MIAGAKRMSSLVALIGSVRLLRIVVGSVAWRIALIRASRSAISSVVSGLMPVKSDRAILFVLPFLPAFISACIPIIQQSDSNMQGSYVLFVQIGPTLL